MKAESGDEFDVASAEETVVGKVFKDYGQDKDCNGWDKTGQVLQEAHSLGFKEPKK